jgi:hypothetical protein
MDEDIRQRLAARQSLREEAVRRAQRIEQLVRDVDRVSGGRASQQVRAPELPNLDRALDELMRRAETEIHELQRQAHEIQTLEDRLRAAMAPPREQAPRQRQSGSGTFVFGLALVVLTAAIASQCAG